MGNSHVKSVWVLSDEFSYEYTEIFGVFLHKEDAGKLEDTVKKRFGCAYINVDEFKVIESSDGMVGKNKRDLNKFFDKYAGV